MKVSRKLTYQPTQGEQTNSQMACSNTVMDITMPLMSVFIAFSVPAAIGVYWIFKSLLGMAKQFAIAKAMPYPTFTEEDYKAAEKEYAGKPPKKSNPKSSIEATKHNPKSLFHMDDEDYDPNLIVPTPEERTTTADPSLSAPLKDESDKPSRQKKSKDEDKGEDKE
jgi:hypothetical protein